MSDRKEKDRKRAIADAFQEMSAYTYKIYAPEWNARSDVLKTLASVSSGAIILSVTFSSSLASLKAGLFWRFLVLFTFAMFGLSLLSALAALWIGIGLHTLQSKFVDSRAEIMRLVDDIDPSSTQLAAPFDGVLHRINKSLERQDRRAERLCNASFITFALAALSLIAIAFRQFLT